MPAFLRNYLVVALVAGVVFGLLVGGRPRHLATKRFRWWLLLPAGLALQSVVTMEGAPAPVALLLISYAYLLLFAVANLHHRGMGVVLVGIALNAAVIAANGGMPVRPAAIRAAGAGHDVPATIDDVKHKLERGGERFMVLADIIPVRPLRQVLSFGDLVLAVGVVDVIVHLMRPVRRSARSRARRRARRPGTATSATSDAAGSGTAPGPLAAEASPYGTTAATSATAPG